MHVRMGTSTFKLPDDTGVTAQDQGTTPVQNGRNATTELRLRFSRLSVYHHRASTEGSINMAASRGVASNQTNRQFRCKVI